MLAPTLHHGPRLTGRRTQWRRRSTWPWPPTALKSATDLEWGSALSGRSTFQSFSPPHVSDFYLPAQWYGLSRLLHATSRGWPPKLNTFDTESETTERVNRKKMNLLFIIFCTHTSSNFRYVQEKWIKKSKLKATTLGTYFTLGYCLKYNR